MKNARNRAFSAQTERSAVILLPAFDLAASMGMKGVIFHGAWVDRCFVIANITFAAEMPRVPANPLSMTLTLPTTMPPAEVAQACHRFGVVVEQIWRDVDRAKFDFVASVDDADRHIVHRYNDAAVCGHHPQRWVSDEELGDLAKELQSCSKCLAVSAAMRWRP